MKPALLKAGGRNGALVVVDRAMTHCLPVPEGTPHLRAALEDWDRCAPVLAELARALEAGDAAWTAGSCTGH